MFNRYQRERTIVKSTTAKLTHNSSWIKQAMSISRTETRPTAMWRLLGVVLACLMLSSCSDDNERPRTSSGKMMGFWVDKANGQLLYLNGTGKLTSYDRDGNRLVAKLTRDYSFADEILEVFIGGTVQFSCAIEFPSVDEAELIDCPRSDIGTRIVRVPTASIAFTMLPER